MVRVSSAEFQRKFDQYCQTAMREPLTITSYSGDSLVLLSAGKYERLKRRDREVLQLGELSREDLEAIVSAEWPEEAKALDHELDEADRA